MATVSGVRTWRRAKVWAPAFEPVFAGGRTTKTPSAWATSPVPSVEQSSTTMIAAGGEVWACRLLIVSATLATALYAGMITVTSSRTTGRRKVAPRLRFHRCFRRPALEGKGEDRRLEVWWPIAALPDARRLGRSLLKEPARPGRVTQPDWTDVLRRRDSLRT